MSVAKISSSDKIRDNPITSTTRLHYSVNWKVHSTSEEVTSFELFQISQSLEKLLLTKTKVTCDKYKIKFAQLSGIQRKFLTHFRCSRCGLLPLYQIDPLHLKRVRCRKCGELVSFKSTGKYGKFRKEIARELVKDVQSDV